MWQKLMVAAIALIASPVLAGAWESCNSTSPCPAYGAQVFKERCSLCHGSNGMGDGVMPLLIDDYPNTNLLRDIKANEAETIEQVVRLGGELEDISAEMPPWGDELTHSQLEAVTAFILALREQPEHARELLLDASVEALPSNRLGRAVFKGRCSICHGDGGKGDGKMSRIIKDPSPFDLTQSVMPEAYLTAIIEKGGAELGRSPRMPPFGGDLSNNEIASLVIYLHQIREPQSISDAAR